jgi:hypothetical protein
LENVIRDSVTYTEHARRKTVTAMDVVYAVRRLRSTSAEPVRLPCLLIFSRACPFSSLPAQAPGQDALRFRRLSSCFLDVRPPLPPRRPQNNRSFSTPHIDKAQSSAILCSWGY